MWIGRVFVDIILFFDCQGFLRVPNISVGGLFRIRITILSKQPLNVMMLSIFVRHSNDHYRDYFD